MFTVNEINSETTEIKKSTFVAYIAAFDTFDDTLQMLRDEHKKSRHIVWAYRHFNEHQQIVENSSDDGEPKNTSGKPTLKVLQGNDLINVVIFTVRYFGGIKLGTGGLVRAYTDAAAKVIESATLIDLSNLYSETINIYYPHTRQTDHLLNSLSLTVTHKDFGANEVTYFIQGNETTVLKAVNEIQKFNRS